LVFWTEKNLATLVYAGVVIAIELVQQKFAQTAKFRQSVHTGYERAAMATKLASMATLSMATLSMATPVKLGRYDNIISAKNSTLLLPSSL
jgi:hypothetical protein